MPCKVTSRGRWGTIFAMASPTTKEHNSVNYKFRQHLPAVLQIHVVEGRLCIRRTTGRCCRNSITDRSRAWKLTASTHPRAVQKTWTILNRYGYRYAKICIFPTVSLSNGRCLARLRDIRTWYGKKGLLCLTLLSCKVTSRGQGGTRRQGGAGSGGKNLQVDMWL